MSQRLYFSLAQRLSLACLLLASSTCHGNIFDSFIAYRQGNNSINQDSSSFLYEDEPEVPASVDNIFAYTASSSESDKIHVVHCYSMRNGLFGSPTEARIFWSELDFSAPDYSRSGHAENTRAVSLPIGTKIE